MHEQHNLEEQLEDLSDALRCYQDPHIQGAKLNQYIKDVAPGLNVRDLVEIPVGPGALKKFVITYLGDVLKHVGFNGGDVVYSIEGHQGFSETEIGVSPNIWKSFVSPSAKTDVVVSADRTHLINRSSGSLEPEELVVSRVSISEHDSVREDFIDTVSSESDKSLAEASRGVDDYGDWLAVLREKGLYKRWSEFRRNALLALFSSRLRELELDDDIAESLERQMIRSQRSTSTKRPAIESSSVPFTKKPSSTRQWDATRGQSEVEFSRRLAHAAVDAMSYDELRSINLPLGVVLDALNRK